jgi:hypothetical protein
MYFGINLIWLCVAAAAAVGPFGMPALIFGGGGVQRRKKISLNSIHYPTAEGARAGCFHYVVQILL